MLNIVIFGAPGSGKGTQSERIVAKYGINHISTGDVLRAQIKAGTELGKIAKGYIDQGQLLPDELIIDILASTLDSFEDSKGVIFDGFPRTADQAKALLLVTKIDAVIELDASLELVSERILGRVICKNCGQVFSRMNYSADTCDNCGAELYHRSDDTIETVKERYDVYLSYANAIKSVFAEQNILHKIDASEELEEKVINHDNEHRNKHILFRNIHSQALYITLQFQLLIQRTL